MQRTSIIAIFMFGIIIGAIIMPASIAGAGHKGVPHGAIVMFPAGKSCPPGFSNVTALNAGRFPRGGTSSGSGGSAQHTHTLPQSLRDHTHELPDHAHGASGFVNFLDIGGANGSSYGTGAKFDLPDSGESSAYHDHNITGETGDPVDVDTWGGEPNEFIPSSVGTTNNLPPFYKVRFCKAG